MPGESRMDFGVMSIIDSFPQPEIAAHDSRGPSVTDQQAPLKLNSSFYWEGGRPKTRDVSGVFLGLEVAKPREFNVFDKGRNVLVGVTNEFSKV